MPELPEVETIRLGLEKYLVGHKVSDVFIKLPQIFSGDIKNIIGGKVIGVRRFAKVLSIDLDPPAGRASDGFSIVIHIKLTGQLIYRGIHLENPPKLSEKVSGGIGGKHTHVIFVLDKESFLYYNDIRRFGWIKIMKTDEVRGSKFIGKLGPEPAVAKGSGEVNLLTLEKFDEILSKTKRAIKVVLMDQEKIGGIGNIYANDALLLSKIFPKRAANSLSYEEKKNLYNNILKVLKKGLEFGGASELSYVHADGSDGGYQKHFIAYGKDGEICQICKKAKLKKITVGGRGTYYCPNCQR